MTSKFEFFNKQFSKSNGTMKGNHLLLFDGAKQQIIKLEASIGVTKAAKDTIKAESAAASPPEKKTLKKAAGPKQQVFDSATGGIGRREGELIDPASVIINGR